MVAMNIGEVLPQVGRKWRRPKHTFYLATRAYVLQPFFIAPVLPGETMKQLLIQSRCVSDPIKNKLIGWWCEYYVFYVKHRDLDDRDLLVNMMIEPTTSLSSIYTAANVQTYHYGSTPDWTMKCLQRVTECYFRDEDEAWNSGLSSGGMPTAHAWSRGDSWLDSVMVDAAMPDIDPNDTSMQALEPQVANWEYLRAMKMTDMTYEDYLRTYGVNIPKSEELHRPELVRYLREWSYPTNTVDPLTGKPTSALSWSIAERADKDRFFKEPGWLFGVTVARPKIYMSNLKGSAAGLMASGMSWLPAVMQDEPWTSLVQIPTTYGPIPGITDVGGYWVDIRDLLLYGDQFTNQPSSGSSANFVTLPDTGGNKRYVTEAEAAALFVTPATECYFRQDGVVSLAILGTQQNTT